MLVFGWRRVQATHHEQHLEPNAKRFAKFTEAKAALKLAKFFRPFVNARIIEVLMMTHNYLH